MTFDFETVAPRHLEDSLKWSKYRGKDILPMWVADMDFRSPPVVIEAIKERVDQGVFGYGGPTTSQVEAVLEALQREFNWSVKAEWLVWLPGLVSGLSVTCRAVGNSGDGVLVNTPVYPPFLKVPGLMDRRLQAVSLDGDNTQGWTMERENFAGAITEDTSLFLLCHPHNPVGRMWTKTELTMMAEECLKKDVIICSDEIHNQLILDPTRRHQPMATLGDEIAARTITLMAPSKTFNVPGLGCSLAIIPDDSIRRRFEHAALAIVPHVNVLGLAAAEACWRLGGPWLEALIQHLRQNRDYLFSRVEQFNGITMPDVEATYLAWLNVKQLGLENPATFFEDHGVGLSDGNEFRGDGFLRLNFGCSRAILTDACDRIQMAVRDS